MDPMLQPKSAFWCFPLVPSVDLEGQARVELARPQLCLSDNCFWRVLPYRSSITNDGKAALSGRPQNLG